MRYSTYFLKSTPSRVFSISFNTLRSSFRHIEDVHEDFVLKKKKKSLLRILINYSSMKKFDAVNILCN